MDFVQSSQQFTLVRITVLVFMIGTLVFQLQWAQANTALAAENTSTYLPAIRTSSSAHVSATALVPAQVLNLTNWKITLPIGSSGNPTEIKQPQLATYQIDP